jgi:hypothetical protein
MRCERRFLRFDSALGGVCGKLMCWEVHQPIMIGCNVSIRACSNGSKEEKGGNNSIRSTVYSFFNLVENERSEVSPSGEENAHFGCIAQSADNARSLRLGKVLASVAMLLRC